MGPGIHVIEPQAKIVQKHEKSKGSRATIRASVSDAEITCYRPKLEISIFGERDGLRNKNIPNYTEEDFHPRQRRKPVRDREANRVVSADKARELHIFNNLGNKLQKIIKKFSR